MNFHSIAITALQGKWQACPAKAGSSGRQGSDPLDNSVLPPLSLGLNSRTRTTGWTPWVDASKHTQEEISKLCKLSQDRIDVSKPKKKKETFKRIYDQISLTSHSTNLNTNVISYSALSTHQTVYFQLEIICERERENPWRIQASCIVKSKAVALAVLQEPEQQSQANCLNLLKLRRSKDKRRGGSGSKEENKGDQNWSPRESPKGCLMLEGLGQENVPSHFA